MSVFAFDFRLETLTRERKRESSNCGCQPFTSGGGAGAPSKPRHPSIAADGRCREQFGGALCSAL
jgi:hypothetical protein